VNEAIGEWSLPVLMLSLSSYFFSPVQVRRGSDRVAFVSTWHPARLNHDHVVRVVPKDHT